MSICAHNKLTGSSPKPLLSCIVSRMVGSESHIEAGSQSSEGDVNTGLIPGEVIPEAKYKLQVVYGSHCSGEELSQGVTHFWSAEVMKQVEDYHPTQIVVDSILSMTTGSSLGKKIPLRHPGGTFPDRDVLYVLGSEILTVHESLRNGEVDVLDALFRGRAREKEADKPVDGSASVERDLSVGYVSDAALIIGLFIVSIGLKNWLTTQSFSRRDFLVLAGAGIWAARGLSLGAVLNGLNTSDDARRSQIVSAITKVIKPVFFNNEFLELRNIKAGLAAHDSARELSAQGKVSGEVRTAIVFGSAHVLEENPAGAEEHLLAQLRSRVEAVVPDLRSYSGLSDDRLHAALSKILGTYVRYEVPQDQGDGTDISSSATFRKTACVERMLDEIFQK